MGKEEKGFDIVECQLKDEIISDEYFSSFSLRFTPMRDVLLPITKFKKAPLDIVDRPLSRAPHEQNKKLYYVLQQVSDEGFNFCNSRGFRETKWHSSTCPEWSGRKSKIWGFLLVVGSTWLLQQRWIISILLFLIEVSWIFWETHDIMSWSKLWLYIGAYGQLQHHPTSEEYVQWIWDCGALWDFLKICNMSIVLNNKDYNLSNKLSYWKSLTHAHWIWNAYKRSLLIINGLLLHNKKYKVFVLVFECVSIFKIF